MMRNKYVLFVGACLLLSLTGSARAEGAIAVDDQPGQKPSDAGFGIGFGDTPESAQRAALAKCNSAGNESCKVVIVFDQCGAYASSNERFGVGSANSEDDAKVIALQQCGNGHCRVVASDCG